MYFYLIIVTNIVIIVIKILYTLKFIIIIKY